MRRMIQAIALLLAVLSGSLPGLYLLGQARSESCCVTMPECPCRPERSPGPRVPCAPAANAPAAILAAPCRAAQARAPRREPSPLPQAFLAQAAARFPLADPSVLARPGPCAPPGPCLDRPALLSVFRI